MAACGSSLGHRNGVSSTHLTSQLMSASHQLLGSHTCSLIEERDNIAAAHGLFLCFETIKQNIERNEFSPSGHNKHGSYERFPGGFQPDGCQPSDHRNRHGP